MTDPEIKNTTAAMRDDPLEPLMMLVESMGPGGSGAAIEHQEREGQRQVVNSSRLPSECRDRAELESLGFTFGEPGLADPLFMPATLPRGWKREVSDHDMWSYVVDQHGRKRVAVFYKAAFYDRRAFMRLEGLESYVAAFVEYDGPPVVITDEWATPQTVAAAMRHLRDRAVSEAADLRRLARESDRPGLNQASLLEYAAEYDAVAAKYATRLAEVTR